MEKTLPSINVASSSVHLAIARPPRFRRLQLLLRVVVFCTLGMVGLSFAGLFMLAYLALPVYAAMRANTPDGAAAYVRDDRGRVLVLLRWFAAVNAWLGLVTDSLPVRSPDEVVNLVVDGVPSPPTSGSALARVLTGLPSALVLMFLGCIGAFVWAWAALTILLDERVGPTASAYLRGLQQWSVRLLAYQASLTDAYPPFSFNDAPALAGPGA
jgi:hypothetical protein